jgi:CBS domain-containing protein
MAMRVKEAMHEGATWCTPDTSVEEVAQLLRDEDIGCVPVGEDDKLVGMVTDRDITVRAVANGRDISSMTARDVMTSGIQYVREDDDLDEAIEFLESKKIRRAPVINSKKRLVGFLSLGDISHAANKQRTAELVEAVSAHHA